MDVCMYVCMDGRMYVCIDQAWIAPFRMNERIGGGGFSDIEGVEIGMMRMSFFFFMSPEQDFMIIIKMRLFYI